MKFVSLSLAILLCVTLTVVGQLPTTVKVIGCLQGDGSEQKPWILSGVALPPPPTAASAGGGGGGAGQAGGGGRGAGGGGGGARGGGGGGRGGAAAAPAAPAAPLQLVDLRLTGGLNMAIWRGMKIEVEGALNAKPATGLQELRPNWAHSVQGVCTPK